MYASNVRSQDTKKIPKSLEKQKEYLFLISKVSSFPCFRISISGKEREYKDQESKSQGVGVEGRAGAKDKDNDNKYIEK